MTTAGVSIGPFLVEESGRLALRQADSVPRFTFMWRDRRFGVSIRGEGLNLTIQAGRLPSTSAGAGRRDAATGLLRTLSQHLPPGWRLNLLADHRIQIDAGQLMEMPSTASALIAPVVQLLLRASPVLDLLEECDFA